jgi:hypothetical protein
MATTKEQSEKRNFWLEAVFNTPNSCTKRYALQGLFSVGVSSFAYIVFRESRHIKILLSRRGVVVHYCRSGGVADVVKPPVNASPGPKKDYQRHVEQKEIKIQIGG